ncbi:MAG: GspH/FimT family pseudopilin [Thiobacillus sp.]
MTVSNFTAGHGFTLIECLVAVGVMAILATVAVPASSKLLLTHRLTSDANTFLAAVHLARSEAIKRNRRVVVCKSASGENCAPAGRWDQGWLVFDDRNNNAVVDEGEEVLRRGPPLRGGLLMTGNPPVAAYISYTPLGLTKKTSGAFQAGTITLCRAGGGEARRIVIGITGRPRVQKATVASCV